MNHTIKSGALIAVAAAAMALSGTASAVTATVSAGDTVHCAGINSCNGGKRLQRAKFLQGARFSGCQSRRLPEKRRQDYRSR